VPLLLACANRSPPYPEVTEADCRVPSASFSQAPWYALPVHLCRFRVRSMWGLFPGTPSLPAESNNREQLTEFVITHWPRNIDLVPIGYAFLPRLRGRLTLRRLALRRNPWTFGDRVFHTVCRYSCQHSHFPYLHRPSRVRLHQLRERSATACTCVHTQSFGAWLEPRYIFGARTLDQ
jgi:hypothetical protein